VESDQCLPSWGSQVRNVCMLVGAKPVANQGDVGKIEVRMPASGAALLVEGVEGLVNRKENR